MSKKIAYIASPVRDYYENFPENKIEMMVEHAKKISQEAKKMGYIPISPVIMFVDIYDDEMNREEVLSDDLCILERCDAFVYRHSDLKKSVGMQKELECAKELGLEIIDIEEEIMRQEIDLIQEIQLHEKEGTIFILTKKVTISCEALQIMFSKKIYFEDCEILFEDLSGDVGFLSFCKCVFTTNVKAKAVHFRSDVIFKECTFQENVDFSRSHFCGDVSFIKSTFGKQQSSSPNVAKFNDCFFDGIADFSSAIFFADVYFHRAIFKRDLQIYRTHFFSVANFYFSTFLGLANFSMAVFKEPKFANFVGVDLSSIGQSDIQRYIKSLVERENDDKDNLQKGRGSVYLSIQHALNLQDSFRTVKDILIAQNNFLDAQMWHKLELYAKEEYLNIRTMQKSRLNKECEELEEHIKSRNDSQTLYENICKTKWENIFDRIQLSFYRITSEHHTNLVKIVNNVILLIALMGCFSLYLLSAKLPKNEEGKMWITSFSGFPLQHNFITMEREENIYYLPQTNIDGSLKFLLDILYKFCSADIVLYSFVLFVFIWLAIQIPRSTRKKVYSLCVVVGLACLFCFACKNLVWLKTWISFFAVLSCFVIIYSLLLLLRNYWLRGVVVVLSYCICICMLIAKPALLLPIFGKFIDETLKINYPLMTSLGVIYSILMFLMLFSLQKTARKNSIIPN